MGFSNPFSYTQDSSVRSLARAISIIVAIFLFIVLVSCAQPDEALSDSTPTVDNPSTDDSVVGTFGSDQQRMFDAFNQTQTPVALSAVAGQINPSANLRPLFLGSSRVEMKVLIISPNGNPTVRDATDPTLDAITLFAENIGIPYDVMIASQENLTEAKLIASNGDGRYQAIILTDSGLGVNAEGTTASAFDQTEWNLLWQYEREFNVRQVSMHTIPGTFPEDLGLRRFDSISTTRNLAQNINITAEGQSIFASLKPSSAIPVKDVVMNLANFCGEDASIACPVGVTTIPVLRTTTENKVIGAVSSTSDGREVLSLLMGQSDRSNHSALLSYDVLKWATQGVFLGAREMYLQIDIDDWFQQSLVWDPVANANTEQTFDITGQDVVRAKAQLDALKIRFPVAANVNYTNAIVGFKGDATETASCAEDANLSQATLCLKDDFDWVSHTYTERAMNFESPGYNNALDPFYNTAAPELNGPLNGYTCDNTALTGFSPTSVAEELAIKEVVCNLGKMQQMGIRVDPKSIITSAHSALGHYNPDPTNPALIDNGLENSSTGSLKGLVATGIRYMASNYSVPSHRGVCEVCGRQHPNFPELFLVPRFPTLMFFNSTNPLIIESQYNFLFGANAPGAPATATNLTYQQILQLDAETTLQHVASAQPYMHFFHQANLDNYSAGNPGQSLVSDWLETFLTRYTSFYDLPLLTLPWEEQAVNIQRRTSYFLSGTTGVWDRATGEVTVTSPNGGTVYVSNAAFANAATSIYGADTIQKFDLGAGQTVSGSTANLPTAPTPAPTPTPNPEPIPEPTPNPEPTPTPLPDTVPNPLEVEPILEPTPQPVLEQVMDVIPEPTAVGVNLLVNGGFENRQSAWSRCGAGRSKIVRDASDGHYAMKLTSNRGGCLYQEVEVVAGTNYTLTCDAKRSNFLRWSSLAITFNDATYSAEVEGDLKEITTTDFSQLSLQATVPESKTIASIVIYSEDIATVDNCDFSATSSDTSSDSTPDLTPSPTPEVTTPASMLSNGGFENNLSNWFSCAGSSSTVSDATSGSRALALDPKTCLYQEVPVTAGQNLVLACQAKTVGTDLYTSIGMTIHNADYSSVLAKQETEVVSTSYAASQVSLTAPAGAATVAVTLYSEDAANFDDCTLVTQ